MKMELVTLAHSHFHTFNTPCKGLQRRQHWRKAIPLSSKQLLLFYKEIPWMEKGWFFIISQLLKQVTKSFVLFINTSKKPRVQTGFQPVAPLSGNKLWSNKNHFSITVSTRNISYATYSIVTLLHSMQLVATTAASEEVLLISFKWYFH